METATEAVTRKMTEPIPPTLAETTSSGMDGLKDIAFGSVAGIVGKVVEFPFDTIKVRLQSQPDHLPLRYTGPLDCFKQSVRQDGFRGLYRGVSAPFAGAAAETACLFWSYRIAQDLIRKTAFPGVKEDALPLSALVSAGAMSGGLTSVILTPIELVKCRMQVPLQSPLDPKLGPRNGLTSSPIGPLTVIADVYRREGLSGFWRGQLGTFLRETGGTAAWFGSYEAISLFFKNRLASQNTASTSHGDIASINLPIHQQMVSGAVAGMSYNFIFYPADTIKSKMQTGELTHVRPTFMSVGKALWRSHGLKGLYRGCGITVARSAPSSALIFTIVENLKTLFA